MRKIAWKRPAGLSIRNQVLLRNLRLGLTIVLFSLQVFGVAKAETRFADPTNVPNAQIEELSRRRIIRDTSGPKVPPSMLQSHLSRVEPADSSDRKMFSTNRDNSRCSSLKRILLGGSQVLSEPTVDGRPTFPRRNKERTTNVRRRLRSNQLNKDAAEAELKENHEIDVKNPATPKFRMFGDYYDMYDGYDDYDDYDDDYDDYYDDDYGMDYPSYY